MRTPPKSFTAPSARPFDRCRRLVRVAVLAISAAVPAACDAELDLTGLGSASGSGNPALDIQGVVSSAVDGSPVEGAAVALCKSGFLQTSNCGTPAITGADGRFRVVGSLNGSLCPAGHWLSASAPGFLGASRSVSCAGGAQVLDISLEPVSSLSVRVWPAPLRLGVGEAVQLSGWVTTRTGGYISDRVTWSSSAPDVAAVSASGLVTGVAKGTAVITAEGAAQPGTASVTVMDSGLRTSGPVAYVSASDVGGGKGLVRVIEVATGAVVGSPIALAVGNIALSPDRKWIYMTTGAGLAVLDAATNAVVVPSIPTAVDNAAIAVAPDGGRAYVTHPESNRISIIDLATRTVVRSIFTPDGPAGIVITPDGKRAYVSHYRSLDVSVFDLAAETSVGEAIPMGIRPMGMAITPDGTRVLVSIQFSSSVAVIDVATNTTAGSFAVGTWPDGIVITPDGKRAYVMNSGSMDVSVLDLAKNEMIGSIAIGSRPWSAAVTPDGKTVFVTCSSGDILRIDVASNALVGSPIKVGFDGVAVAIRP
ncbi:MAG: hypothetical protein FIA95_05315 [Gemmatimonadetes bacterium]|nr:hypothetical protein [Gemmatimonadota bacterium]